ncbi:hypothetical protein LHYA1_G003510 [Lachnellula hyalina]|uniref:Uncharacterized protein n=1 Tax=Lachnellula hyalina TaxID=1316788 RepID=A0A8H8R3S3_9HELO|nr:uncharacterized protein LHYA1_G003510 [Lachnellula hyalina]TVY27973.1 hypothetical protein LHYA1_G003510 [Lachnellula hyalina]
MAAHFQVGWMTILLAGCTSSNSLTNVYLLSVSYLNTTTLTADPAQVNSNISNTFSGLTGAGIWLCSSSATTLANLLKSQTVGASLFEGSVGDPLNLIWIAGKFKEEIVFDGLVFTAVPLVFITILLLATFPGWHEEGDAEGSEREAKPFPSRPVSQLALGLITLASLFAFVSSLWQHIVLVSQVGIQPIFQHIATSAAASMIRSLSYGTVRGHVGPAAMALGWVGVFFSIVVTIGLLIMVLSIRVLAETFAEGS